MGVPRTSSFALPVGGELLHHAVPPPPEQPKSETHQGSENSRVKLELVLQNGWPDPARSQGHGVLKRGDLRESSAEAPAGIPECSGHPVLAGHGVYLLSSQAHQP